MKNRIFVLVDPTVKGFEYSVLCENTAALDNRFSIIESGVTPPNPVQIELIRSKYENTKVIVDGGLHSGEIQRAADYFGWMIVKYKECDFPYIELVMQAARSGAL